MARYPAASSDQIRRELRREHRDLSRPLLFRMLSAERSFAIFPRRVCGRVSRIPAEAFSPGRTLVIRQVEKGHRKIHKRNSRGRRDRRGNSSKFAQIARIIPQPRVISIIVSFYIYTARARIYRAIIAPVLLDFANSSNKRYRSPRLFALILRRFPRQ